MQIRAQIPPFLISATLGCPPFFKKAVVSSEVAGVGERYQHVSPAALWRIAV